MALAFYVGQRSVLVESRSFITSAQVHQTLGSLLPTLNENFHNVTPAYRTPPDIATISWAVPNVPAPFVGSAPEPGVHANATINSSMARDTREFTERKQANEFRVFLVGGSVAYGSGAPGNEQTVGAFLERYLRERVSVRSSEVLLNVFTIANPAWASTQERILIENYLSERNPDLIVSLSGCNDVYWGHQRRNVLWFRAFYDDYYLELLRQLYLALGFPEPRDLAPAEASITPETIGYRLAKNVKLAISALAEKDVPYFFFLQPHGQVGNKPLTVRESKFIKREANSPAMQAYHAIDQALRAVRGENFYYRNISDVFDSLPKDYELFIDSVHVGDKGNQLLAERIGRELVPVIEKMIGKH